MANIPSHLSEAVARARRTSPYEDAEGPVEELTPRLVVVTDSDRARAPVLPVPEGVPVPTRGTLEEIAATFAADPSSGAYLEYPTWPVCCDRPTTLIAAETPFDRLAEPSLPADVEVHYLEGEIREDWGMTEEQASRAIAQLDDPSAPEPVPRPTGLLGRALSLGWKPWLEGYAELRAAARDGKDGTALFHCRACGRLYLGSHHVP